MKLRVTFTCADCGAEGMVYCIGTFDVSQVKHDCVPKIVAGAEVRDTTFKFEYDPPRPIY
jgi:hypothetical protein